jgi:hypothetical protein
MTALRFGTRRSFGPCSDPKLNACLERTRPDSLKRRSSHFSQSTKWLENKNMQGLGEKASALLSSHDYLDSVVDLTMFIQD